MWVSLLYVTNPFPVRKANQAYNNDMENGQQQDWVFRYIS